MTKKLEVKVRGWLAGALVLFVMFGMTMLTEAKSLTSVSPEQAQIKVTNNDSEVDSAGGGVCFGFSVIAIVSVEAINGCAVSVTVGCVYVCDGISRTGGAVVVLGTDLSIGADAFCFGCGCGFGADMCL